MEMDPEEFDAFLNQQGIAAENPLFPNMQDHAVIIHFHHGIDELEAVHALENQLDTLLEESRVGRVDGHEVAMDDSDGFLYLYGPNAETLFKTVLPVLQRSSLMTGATAYLRFGPPEDESPNIELQL